MEKSISEVVREVLMSDLQTMMDNDWTTILQIKEEAEKRVAQDIEAGATNYYSSYKKQDYYDTTIGLVRNGFSKAVQNIYHRGESGGKLVILKELKNKINTIVNTIDRKIGDAELVEGQVSKASLFTTGCLLKFRNDNEYFIMDLRTIQVWSWLVRPHFRTICTTRKCK